MNGTTVKKKTVRLWVNGTNDTKRTVSLWVDGTTITRGLATYGWMVQLLKRTVKWYNCYKGAASLWMDGTTVTENKVYIYLCITNTIVSLYSVKFLIIIKINDFLFGK